MIRHIVLFSAKNETDIARVIDGLALLAKIPHARRFEIARNAKIDAKLLLGERLTTLVAAVLVLRPT